MKFNVITLIQICSALVVRDLYKRQESALDYYKKIVQEGLTKRETFYVEKRTVTEVCCQAPFISVSGRCVEPNLMTFDEPQFSGEFGELNDGYFGMDWPTGETTIYINKYAFSFYPGTAQGVVSAPNGLINNYPEIPIFVGTDGGIVFSVASLYLNALKNPANIASFIGTRNGVVVATYSVPITNETPVFVNLGAQGFSNIDKLSIIGDGSDGSWLVIDDLSTTLTNP